MEYQANHKFGTASSIRAESVGEPGHRTFRLILHAGAASAILWLEKEQLYQMAMYIQETSREIPTLDTGEIQDGPEEPWQGDPSDMEFWIGKLALGHDTATNAFLFLAHNVESEEGSPAELSFWVTLENAQELCKEAIRVCAAGRPRCFLCGQPINPEGHMCIRSNGHHQLDA